MRHVVARVAEYATGEHGRGDVPIPKEDKVREVPERVSEDGKEGGWHDQTIFVHGQVMVDAVEGEVECDAHTIIG